jgi:type VI secretion system secreted protein Hcp
MAVDYYLKLDTIKGESQATGHVGEIQLLSFSWGGSQTSSVAGTGGSGAGKVNLQHLNIMKNLDSGTVPMFKAITLGSHIATGTLTAIKAGAGGKPFLQVDLTELFVSSIDFSASSEIPTETVSFSYNQIAISYFSQDEKGTMSLSSKSTYNLKTNTTS